MKTSIQLIYALFIVAQNLGAVLAADTSAINPLPGTQPLTMPGDIASNLVAGVDRFLLRELDRSVERGARHWKRDFSSADAYVKSIEPNRQRLAHILGLRDKRVRFDAPGIVATVTNTGPIFRGNHYEVYHVRWPAFGDVHGEGLLLVPPRPQYRMDPALMKRYGLIPSYTSVDNFGVADVIAIPDADQTPEQIAGLVDGVAPESQFARRLAESGCRVLVPMLINRNMGEPKSPHINRGANISNREFLYRSAFELGRHLIGYELQKVLAAVDWLDRERQHHQGTLPNRKIGVIGWGEGGMLALCAAALDTRIDAALVSGYFDDRRRIWEGPIDRNVFGLLEQFGDAELAAMIAPRSLVIEAAKAPELVLSGKGGGAPAQLVTPELADVQSEFKRAQELIKPLSPGARLELVVSDDGSGPYGSAAALTPFLDSLATSARLSTQPPGKSAAALSANLKARHDRQFHELDRHSQQLLIESPYVRAEFMKKLDASSLEKFENTSAEYRKFFYDEVIGRVDEPVLPPNVRTKKSYDTEKWTGYEVVMDVFPDVIAYGILLLPKDLRPGERRPVVVCQHGLEGRPQDVITGDKGAYHDFAARLADRGFITFSPQNLYIFQDRFRTLQRKANPLKKTLFSIITPQHQQIVDWLKSLPGADPKRIAFYGLSYGGKTAMRVPALITDYCLSICSADFNEWVWKNASSRSPYSYVWTGEYEIFEFDLGSTFNYAEMASLIAPRPFMVERGHFDGVAPDEAVGYEFGKVRFLYAAKLGIGDRCEIEWFVGPHTINGKGTFDFLARHLQWNRK